MKLPALKNFASHFLDFLYANRSFIFPNLPWPYFISAHFIPKEKRLKKKKKQVVANKSTLIKVKLYSENELNYKPETSIDLPFCLVRENSPTESTLVCMCVAVFADSEFLLQFEGNLLKNGFLSVTRANVTKH